MRKNAALAAAPPANVAVKSTPPPAADAVKERASVPDLGGTASTRDVGQAMVDAIHAAG